MEERVLIQSKKAGYHYWLALIGLVLIVPGILPVLSSHGGTVPFLLAMGIAWEIPILLSMLSFRNVSLTVTEKRVFGTQSWGRRIDLPIDMISSVETSSNGRISVSTAAGVIRFGCIKNNREIHEVINELLRERQMKQAEPDQLKPEPAPQTAPAPAPQTKADELREMRMLLDEGLITQEDYDAKKKQLLGL